MLPLVAALLMLLVAVPARADAPARLGTQVTDPAGVLDSSVAPALRALQDKTGIQLFVVFVPSFDGTPAQEWTDETARLSDLGDRDALLAVATTDRAYAYSFPPDSRLSDGELTDVAAERIEPALSRGDWSGAVVAAADGYADAATGSGFSAAWALALLAAIIVVALAWVAARRRHRAAASASSSEPAAGPSVADLSAQANALLIELDDDLRAAESELALATAQYGPDETARFRTALEESRRDVAEAFRLRMTLEDERPEAAEASRTTLEQIIARCRAADERLDAESEAFDQLRDLEGRAAEAAAEVDRRRAAAEAGIPAAAVALQDLSHRWSGPPVSAVAGNIDAASERLRFAAEAVGRARAALASAGAPAHAGSSGSVDGGAPAGGVSPGGAAAGAAAAGGAAGGGVGGARAEAALAVRAAEQAVTQAEQLLAAVRRAATDLQAARAAADALLAEVEGEIVTARGLMQQQPGDAGLAGAVGVAEQALGVARAQLGQGLPDPVAVVAGLQAADATLDQALAAAQDAAARVTHARALLAQALPVARAEVAAASDFIGTRRGVVNAGARTSLSEAQRHLALAESLAEQDPAAALSHAQQAQSLAGDASRSASYDVQTWSSGAGWPGGRGGYGSDGVAGAILGGLLFGDGSPGPARRRSPGGGMSWSGGGFGGSGARGRRTGGGGGRSGGGGRRGGGGRF